MRADFAKTESMTAIRIIFAISLFCIATIIQALPQAPSSQLPPGEGPWVVRAYYQQWEQVKNIRDFADTWTVNRREQYVVLKIDSKSQYQQLLAKGVKVAVDWKASDKYLYAPLRFPEGGNTIPGYACYSTVEHTYQRAQDLVTANPDLAEIVDIGDSWEKTNLAPGNGYDLRVLKITNQNIAGTKPVLYAMSSIHAREYTPAELLTRFAEYLLNNYGTDADATWMVDHHEIHLLLHGNPDGRKQAEGGDLWRKTTNQNYCGVTSSSRGADMNRNFSFKWGGAGTSNDQCSDIYRGPFALSETETTAIDLYLDTIFPDQRGPNDTDAAPDDTTGMYLDVHSYSEWVIWPWGWGAPTTAPNHDDLQTIGRRLAWFNGYNPDTADNFGVAAGASDDNAYGRLGVPAYTVELGTQFFQSCNVFENTIYPDNLPLLLYAARIARTPYLTAGGPDIMDPAFNPGAVVPGTLVGVSGIATDSRFNQTNGTESTHNIVQVNAYVDTPPWDMGAVAEPLVAEDGNFDSITDAFAGTLDTTGWSHGPHTVYFTATDADGATGPVYAQYLHVINPATAATLSGVVQDVSDLTPISAPLVEFDPHSTVGNNSGVYSTQAIPGTYDVTFSATGYASKTIDDVVLNSSQTTTLDVTLDPICNLLRDDGESGAGQWTADSPWALVTNNSFSPTHAWHESPGGNYGNNVDVSLTSASLDFSDIQSPELTFASLCETEATYDFGYVEISVNNGGWQQVFACDDDPNWKQEVVDLTAYEGESDVRVRFRFESDVTQTQDGWYVDDIRISGAGACGSNDLIYNDGFEVNL